MHLAVKSSSGVDSFRRTRCRRSYSGKFNLRVGESLHRELAMQAAEDGMSLNQYVLRKLRAA